MTDETSKSNETTKSDDSSQDQLQLEKFNKIITDFSNDLIITFPELQDKINDLNMNISNNNSNSNTYNYCVDLKYYMKTHHYLRMNVFYYPILILLF